MCRFAFVLFAALSLVRTTSAAEPPQIFSWPAVSARHIAFGYAGDLWVVDRTGGTPRRLTAGTGLESHPVFSPDGSQIAFTGEYEGNLDVYVVPVTGGQPRRLTYHPDPDLSIGWTPDGKSVLFRSTRASGGRYTRLFTVPATGGPETEVPLPMAEEASFSPDSNRLAYVPFTNTRGFPGGYIAWKRYRGGSAPFVWIADLKTSAIEKVPRTDSNDFNPMWIGDRVYFLSDRDGSTTLYAYDLNTKNVQRVLESNGRDIKSASACTDAVVFNRIDGLYRMDLKTEKVVKLNIEVQADLPAARPRREKIAKHIQHVGLSPTGARILIEARGEILTVPAEKGDARNLTETPGIAERDPVWSPDGKTVAYFSDASGEYELHLKPQNGLGQIKTYKLGDAPSFYYTPTWSPDSKRIAYTDKRKNLWCLDLATGKSTKVDTDPQALGSPPTPAWSPDSKWIAYTRSLQRTVAAVFLYSVEAGTTHSITDGMSNAALPVFDRDGKYLYFTASTDDGPIAFGSMSAFNRAQTNSVYLIVLSKDVPSPLLPESDEEKEVAAKASDKDKEKSTPPVHIDFENIDQRIVALPVPNRNYVELHVGKERLLFLVEGEAVRATRRGPPNLIVHKFDLGKRKAEKLLDGVRRFVVSHNGEKMLYQQGEKWFLTATPPPAKPGEGAGPPKSGEGPGPSKPGEGAVKLEDVEIRIDPRAEWRQIYRETWRIERDFLYDPNAHGLDLAAAEKKYQPYLSGLGSRHDLSLLMEEMLGELCLGHVYIAGGDNPIPPDSKTGLLGADYTVDQGRYRFARVYRGESWNPDLRAPLLQPGAGVKQGEYLLAVNGKDLRGDDNVYRLFEGTAGKQTFLSVGPKPDGTDSRVITVVPIPNERQLRNLAWVDANRRKVDALSGGRVAYIYVPNTSAEGFERFNRYFFAQTEKQGVVIDERFNGGGQLADHIVDYLRQPLRNYIAGRAGEGDDAPFPGGAIYGPKVMLINERAGSGGDYLPYTFRQAKLGPLVGKRTWGGLVGIGGYPTLIDGGTVTAPRMAIWFPNGRWDVENRGVAPDIEVEFDPQAVREGHDPQLEKAVELVLAELQKNPPNFAHRPAYPNYYKPGLKEPAEGK
ncbi:MAG TPA: PDZ domain-containing protein [Gemmataceae bacterium]|nr:PDZ domain-containing protein [Gemmataceae bacterium]